MSRKDDHGSVDIARTADWELVQMSALHTRFRRTNLSAKVTIRVTLANFFTIFNVLVLFGYLLCYYLLQMNACIQCSQSQIRAQILVLHKYIFF